MGFHPEDYERDPLDADHPDQRRKLGHHPQELGNKRREKVNYDRDLKVFIDAMRYKLDKNSHKGKWEGLDLKKALELLRLEVTELEEAIAKGNEIEIVLEAADVANFALITSSIAIKKAAGDK